MSQFHPMFLSNEENQIISSILDDEESELKGVPFSTQSNINVVEKTAKNPIEISQTDANTFGSSPKSQPYIPTQNLNNFALQQKINAEINTKNKFDINSLKSDVDDLMTRVRQRATRNSSIQISGFQPDTSFTGQNFGYSNMPDSNARQFPNLAGNFGQANNMMNSSGGLHSDGQITGTYFANNYQNIRPNNHVEFPNFPTRKNRGTDFSDLNNYSNSDEKEDEPFTLPKAEFPDSPKVLKYQYSRRPDTSKHDLAELDQLRKENVRLKSEMLKLEKRLQLEEAEHKKLERSLQLNQEKRAKIQDRLRQSEC